MSFSRLLLVGANSKKYIKGEKNDKVKISPKVVEPGRDLFEGEVILCFQLDEISDQGKQVARCLGISGESQRCDGLVFYSQDDTTDRVICLVEMKSTNIDSADEQIKSTKRHIKELLQRECNSLSEEYRSECSRQIARIKWKACLYHSSSSSSKIDDFQRALKADGFTEVNILRGNENDLRPLLTGKGNSAKDIAQRIRKGRHR